MSEDQNKFIKEVKALNDSPVKSFEQWVKCPCCKHDIPESLLKKHLTDCLKYNRSVE